jgi:hypothetical protein
MKMFYKYDSDGYYSEPVVVDDWKDGDTIPDNCTDKPVTQPCINPRFINGKWRDDGKTRTQEQTPQQKLAALSMDVQQGIPSMIAHLYDIVCHNESKSTEWALWRNKFNELQKLIEFIRNEGA